MTQRRPNLLSTSSEAAIKEATQHDPSDLAPLSQRMPKGPKGKMNEQVMAIIRAEYESGTNIEALAQRHGMSARTIHRWKKKEEWERNPEVLTDMILQKARQSIEQKAQNLSQIAEADVERVIQSHRAASKVLQDLLTETLAKVLAYPHEDPFRQLLTIKVGTEVARNIQMMDRKSWGLEDRAKGSTTAIYELLQGMDDTVEKKAVRIEEKY